MAPIADGAFCSTRSADKQIEENQEISVLLRRRSERDEEMEKYFGNAYRGDPGVPHADPDRFVNIWIGSAAFSVLTWFNPYMWQLSNQFKYSSSTLILLRNSLSRFSNLFVANSSVFCEFATWIVTTSMC